MSVNLLELKLKRHQITFSKENEKIIIGKVKMNNLEFIGLVIFPIIIASGIVIFYLNSNIELTGTSRIAVVGGTVFLFSSGVFNFSRIKSKSSSNSNIKVVESKSITLINEYGQFIFNSKNIVEFNYTVDQIGEDTYEAILYLRDTMDRQHQILGFDDENEKYALDDIKWFADYLSQKLDVQTVANNI